jgi:hypothetical protein
MVLAAVIVLGGAPAATGVTTEATVAARIARLIADGRASLGLPAYGVDTRLAGIAARRARVLADAQTLSHSLPGDLGEELRAAGIRADGWGEIIGYTGVAWGPEVATQLYGMWRGSPTHWSLIRSRDYNRMGVGVARATDGTAYAAVVFIDSPAGSGIAATPRPAATPRATPRPTPAPTPTPAPVLASSIRDDPWQLLGGPRFGRAVGDGLEAEARAAPPRTPFEAFLGRILEALAGLLGWVAGDARD